MIASLIVILACQLAGEAIARGLHIPIPGPVIGIALLFALLVLRDHFAGRLPDTMKDGGLEKTGQGLLAHLSLLFIPAGVGVIQNLDVLAQYGTALGVAILVSTVLSLLTAAGTFLLVAHLCNADESVEDER